jgi:hypothetical protein
LSAAPPLQGARWFSAGFPAAAKRDEQRKPASFAGSMHSMARMWQHFEVDVDACPEEEDGWKGASGMPIFSGDKIFGVAKEVPLRFNSKRLHVVPAFKLLQYEDFAKKIDYAAQRNRRLDFERKLATIFQRSKDAIDLLRRPNCLMDGVDLVPNDEAGGVARALLGRGMEEAINGLTDVHEDIFETMRLEKKDDLRTAADVLVDAVLLLISCLFDDGVASGVRDHILNPQAALLEIPCALPTVAEIAMAAAENRQSEFQSVHDDMEYPIGLRQIPHPPEGGIAAWKENQEAIRQALMRKFSPGGWTDFRNSIDDYLFTRFVRSTSGLDRTGADRIKQASAELINESRRSRYYVVYYMPKDEDARRELRDGLSELKKDYQALIFLGLTDDIDVDLAERTRYGPLRRMLGRKRHTKD